MMKTKRKGISPLIATVLLIAFTIAVGGIISVWLTQFARSQADEQTTNADKANLCSESTLFFSKTDVNVSGSYLWLIVTNEGSQNQTDIDVYVTHKNGSLATNTTPQGTPSATSPLQPGQRIFLNASMMGNTLVFGDKTNISTVTVVLGPGDQCAGKSYKVTF